MKKKLLSLFAVAVCSLSALATDYTGTLTVTVNGSASSQSATITVDENADNTYNLVLKNFVLKSGDQTVPVGNIEIDSLAAVTTSGVTMLYVDRSIKIAAGDDSSVSSWLGPMLGAVPIKMSARFNASNLMVTSIDIDMKQLLGQSIAVLFENVGTHFQMPNGDFETWTSATAEPRYWHSFASGSGSWVRLAPGKIASSTDVPSGIGSTTSVVVTSGKFWGVVGNGTFTNGRINAGSTTAANTANHSETYGPNSTTATDKNGDLFVTPMHAAPDSLTLWLKFSQAEAQTTYKYATVNCVLTDGTSYQDPEDKTYTNKAAVASDSKITVTGWKHMSLPFDYDSYASNKAQVKAVLLTISTNATPGKGSSGDQVWVDNVKFVYNAALSSLKFKDTQLLSSAADTATRFTIADYEGDAPQASDFAVTAVGKSAVVGMLVQTTDSGYVATVTVVSGDLMTAKTYVVNFVKKAPAKGDLNQDGIVDVADVTLLVNKLLGIAVLDDSQCDLNHDGIVDVADVTTLVNIITAAK